MHGYRIAHRIDALSILLRTKYASSIKLLWYRKALHVKKRIKLYGMYRHLPTGNIHTIQRNLRHTKNSTDIPRYCFRLLLRRESIWYLPMQTETNFRKIGANIRTNGNPKISCYWIFQEMWWLWEGHTPTHTLCGMVGKEGVDMRAMVTPASWWNRNDGSPTTYRA